MTGATTFSVASEHCPRLRKGVHDLERELTDREHDAEVTGGTPDIPLTELFPVGFMTKYTDFSSLEAMVQTSGFEIASRGDVQNIPASEWNDFIARHTQFSTWEQMQQTAAVEWAARQVGLDTADPGERRSC